MLGEKKHIIYLNCINPVIVLIRLFSAFTDQHFKCGVPYNLEYHHFALSLAGGLFLSVFSFIYTIKNKLKVNNLFLLHDILFKSNFCYSEFKDQNSPNYKTLYSHSATPSLLAFCVYP